jgi:pimeloyl-ACP methyl ester carboxylesterase
MIAHALAALLASAPTGPATLPLHPCVVQGTPARCGTLVVPENRERPARRSIGLRVVVIPSIVRPARGDAFTYLAGGPGGAATRMTAAVMSIWPGVHRRRDIVLVDQRGTGGSHALECPQPTAPLTGGDDLRAYVDACIAGLDGDPVQYGTAAAADDLDAARAALGYRRLDVYGTSYGATVAQVYLKRHPRSVRTVVLDGGTLIDVPFFTHFASNGERALGLIAARCAADRSCARAFPRWRAQLDSLIAAWNAEPVRVGGASFDGDALAGVVHALSLDAGTAAQIPLLVARAAAGDTSRLAMLATGGGATRSIMYWSIWCNEPWVGLDPAAAAADAKGTYLEGYVADALAGYTAVCRVFPSRAEPAVRWTRPRSRVPLLAIVGGADPQDPIGSLTGLRAALPNSRMVVEPGQGHAVGQYGCVPLLVTRFVERGSASGLDTSCARRIPVPAFMFAS